MSCLQGWILIGALAVPIMARAQETQEAAQARQDATLRMNQVQVIGTHNSYHAGFAPSEAKLMQEKNPKVFEALDYGHQPLPQQLSSGVRQIEIDVYADAKGGRFAHPAITGMVAAAHLPTDPELDPHHLLDRPGFKVMHVVGIDQRSTCSTFVACLTTVKTWSQANPRHLPLFILVETKQDKPGEVPKPYAVATEPFTAAAFDALESEILSVFSKDQIITPDIVRGAHSTLPDAIRAGGWPTLHDARGKVVFLLDQASVTPLYTEGHPALRGRLAFTNAKPGTADAAFVEQNDGSPEAIDALVRQGYLVRTRTDEPTAMARTNETRRRELAMRSGAQMLSTDYPASEPARWPGHYQVALPQGEVARCNPVNKPTSCVDDLLDGTTGRVAGLAAR